MWMCQRPLELRAHLRAVHLPFGELLRDDFVQLLAKDNLHELKKSNANLRVLLRAVHYNTAQTYVSHDDDEDQVDARGGHAADELRVEAQLLGHEALVELGPLEEHERDDRAVHDDGHDEDDNHHYLWCDISDM